MRLLPEILSLSLRGENCLHVCLFVCLFVCSLDTNIISQNITVTCACMSKYKHDEFEIYMRQ